MKNSISTLALAGLLSGSLALGATGCGKDNVKPDAIETPTSMPASAPASMKAPTDAKPMPSADDGKYSELHGCAGLNVCKGLGGCKVTAEKLAKLAEAAGTPADKAGEPHDCSGKNACKGLGGCSVDEAKLTKLKAALAPAQ